MDPIKIMQEYQDRLYKRRWLNAAMVVLLFLAPVFASDSKLVQAGVIILFLLLAGLHFYIWRCPSCKRGLGYSSKHCPHCGVKLRIDGP